MASFVYYQLGVIDWFSSLFKRDDPQGFIYDFQILLGGLLAFGAGFYVWINGKEQRKYEKSVELDKYFIKKASLATAILAEFTNIEMQEKRLQVLSVLVDQQKLVALSDSQGQKEFLFEGMYFFFKDEILPVYYSNTDKIGLLDPNVCKVVVTTASLIISAVRQIELISTKNLNLKNCSINEAKTDFDITIRTLSQALESIKLCNEVLNELIDKNYNRLSSVNEYF